MNGPAVRLEADGAVVELWPSAAYAVEHVRPTATLGFAFETQQGEDAIGLGRRRPFLRRASSLSWVPAGCPVYSRSQRGGEYLVVHAVRPERIGHADAMQRPITNLFDQAAVAAAQSLRRQLLSGRSDRLEATLDSLCSVLLSRLENKRDAGSHWLTDARRAAIDSYLDRHMHERVCVTDLAAELGLSVGFLVLAFRRGLGMTPHRYLVERRLARARLLLLAKHPIAETAEECGFADQAHLTRQMRSLLGVTPGAIRAG